LGATRFQIEIERFFSLVRILIIVRRCRLQTENLKKLIFVNKNYSNDLRIGCKSLFNLLKSLEKDVHFKKELEKFAGEFEKDEVVEV
jgi:hypothetical protein